MHMKESNLERHITLPCSDLDLEGLFAANAPDHAAVITHPHPMYGGDMYNGVVETISKAYHSNGWSTLRFNFRGAGNSQGKFDNGNGEQKDVSCAIAWLREAGYKTLELAGYSFGAWVLACLGRQEKNDFLPMRFVAPPVSFIDFGPISKLNSLRQVIVGTEDEFAPLGQCESLLPQWNPRAVFSVIEGADHFYWNRMDELQKVLKNTISMKKN